jgi:hypothetical protein
VALLSLNDSKATLLTLRAIFGATLGRWVRRCAGERYRGGMGMFGKLFDDGQLRDEGGEDGEGKVHHPRFNIDLDSGVVRLPALAPKPAGDAPTEQPESDDRSF